MEINDTNSLALVNYLQQTLSHDANVRRPAEKYLESVEANRNYPLLLLHLINKDEIDLVIRIAASVTFKNFIKRNWPIEDTDKVDSNDRLAIKQNIIAIMLKREEQIQRQLSDAVSIIGRYDFPEKWPQLLDELIERIQSSGGNFSIINGILQTCNSLFRRFRYEFKSQELWTTIKYVLDKFAKPFTDLFVATVELAAANSSNPAALKIIFSSLVLCSKIFYSLNSQDLPEFFEDNLSIWMPHFLNLLSIDNKSLRTSDDEEAGLLEQLKSQICDNVSMYAQKYHEEFEPYLPGFLQSVWNLLVSTGREPKYDLLVSNAIHFLSTVAYRSQFKKLFEEPGVLDSLCSKVIIPNIEFRASDEELFEDNPEEYIRMDIEGSDVDTRRRASCDLIKSLSKYFEIEITQVFSTYIQNMLQAYASNPKQAWRSKDAAIYLVTAMSVKGSTARFGTTQTSELVNVIDFFNQFIKADLENSKEMCELPVLRADVLKYIVTFRNQLPYNEVILPSLPHIIAHLSSPSVVVHTYAAHCLERLFTVNHVPNVPADKATALVNPAQLEQLTQPLIAGLFSIFSMDGSTENEYAMRAVMKSLFLLQERVYPFLEEIISKLTTKLSETSKNPSKPNFNHYLFECISLCIKIGQAKNPNCVTSFEQILFPIFQVIIVQDIQEFISYVFQVLSLLIELRGPEPVPDFYMQLLPALIAPTLWERSGNVHPSCRLLQALLNKNGSAIVAAGRLEGILGVFQKLISSKMNDHEGFNLICSIIEYLEPNEVASYMKQVFIILFWRLSNFKTPKFVNKLLVFFSLFAFKYGTPALETMIDGIQARMFGMVIERLFIAEAQKLTETNDKKMVAVGMTKILCELPSTITGEYLPFWPKLLQALIGLFELPEEAAAPEESALLAEEDVMGYQAFYSKLHYGSRRPTDPFKATIPDARFYLVQSLGTLSQKYPGKLTPIISSQLAPEAVQHLQKYLTAANITIA